MRTTLRSAAVALTAAVVLPVLPAVVSPAPAHAAAPVSSSVDFLLRDARAKTTVARLAQRKAEDARWTYLAATPDRREPARAAAIHAAKHARATGIIAHLARRKAAAAKPAPAAAPRASRGGERTAPTGVWDRLAQCESGGNWRINTGNGYYGGLQFSLGSWRAVGGSGFPHQASRTEQIARGEKLKAKQGWGAWPACSRKLGLR